MAAIRMRCIAYLQAYLIDVVPTARSAISYAELSAFCVRGRYATEKLFGDSYFITTKYMYKNIVHTELSSFCKLEVIDLYHHFLDE